MGMQFVFHGDFEGAERTEGMRKLPCGYWGGKTGYQSKKQMQSHELA
jgi:hypothetical protein